MTTVLPMAQYGWETWSFIIRVEHIIRLFENNMLRSIFGLKKDEVKEGWRNMHNEELREFLR
jgi:hypothetical protein